MISLSQTFERLLGALVLGGTADALGWRNEFAHKGSSRKRTVRLQGWSKRIGRIGGYWEKIQAGEYSDDTQLTLAVARCVSPDGTYDADRFAQVELPYWLSYQRGGGRTVKAAAQNILSHPTLSWDSNVFPGILNAGANGVAMRVLAFSTIDDINEMELSIWKNALATHGHPRAIVGALTLAFSLHHLLRTTSFSIKDYFEELVTFVKDLRTGHDDEKICSWIRHAGEDDFSRSFEATKHEMIRLLTLARESRAPKEEVLEQLGCYKPNTKGSGTATVAAGHYFFLKYYDKPKNGVIEAVNSLGSDTDTIGKFCGDLLGCLWGKKAYENELTENVQDRYYFLRCASQLTGREEPDLVTDEGEETDISQPQKEGNEYFSRVFGSGVIIQPMEPKEVHRRSATLHQARVQFFNGITCVFSKMLSKDRPRSNQITFSDK